MTEGTKDDGDIVLTTDNEYFIKGSHKKHNIITYEKGLAVPAKITTPNITSAVMKGFGTGVGGFSNTATILYAMAAIFDRPGHEDQYTEIMTRIKLLREIVGQEIDRIKGADKPFLPSDWKKFESILPTDSPEEITAKMRRNAMVVSKKPYFFRYLYPELNKKYKQFEASYNQISRDMFGIKFKKLLRKPDPTPEERDLIRKYQKYSPLITAPCTMNKLCRAMESVDLDIKFNKDESSPSNKKPQISLLPTYENLFSDSFSQDKLSLVKTLYQKYTSRKSVKAVTNLMSQTSASEDDVSQAHSDVYDALMASIRDTLSSSTLSTEEFLFYCYRLSSQYSQFNWAFPWDVLEDRIVEAIPYGRSVIPVRDSTSSIEYLGEHYSLKDISDTGELCVQKIWNAIFGSPDPTFDDTIIQQVISESLISLPPEDPDEDDDNSDYTLTDYERSIIDTMISAIDPQQSHTIPQTQQGDLDDDENY